MVDTCYPGMPNIPFGVRPYRFYDVTVYLRRERERERERERDLPATYQKQIYYGFATLSLCCVQVLTEVLDTFPRRGRLCRVDIPSPDKQVRLGQKGRENILLSYGYRIYGGCACMIFTE